MTNTSKQNFLFGMGEGHLSNRAATIAKRAGATLVNHTEPNGRKRHWFAMENLGAPHDERRAQELLAHLQKRHCLAKASAAKLALAIVFTLATIPAALAQAPPSDDKLFSCSTVMDDGRTAQQHLDDLLTAYAADAKNLREMRDEARTAGAEFDNLCRIDVRLGTHEAATFANEQGRRLVRFVDALKADARR